jgi:hypothetical protein
MLFKRVIYFLMVLALLFSGLTGPLTIEVMAIDSGWQVVGTTGISADDAWETNLRLDHDGTPFIVFQDTANEDKATVMKYNGSNWEIVRVKGTL